MNITDKTGKSIEIKDPDATLKQLVVFMQMLEMNPELADKERDAIVYWVDLYEKLLDKI